MQLLGIQEKVKLLKKETSAAFKTFSPRRRRETNRVGEKMKDKSVISF